VGVQAKAEKDELGWVSPVVVRTWQMHARRVADIFDNREPTTPVYLNGLMAGRSHGLWGTNEPDPLSAPDEWLDDVFRDMERNAAAAADPHTFRPFVVEIDPFGTHYIDALFGAPVRYHEGQAWSEELQCDVKDLAVPRIEENPILSASLRLARRAVERTRGRVWIANPVLRCPMNIGTNLFGSRLLEAMHVLPDAAGRALRIIADVIARCMRAFQAVIPAAQRLNSVGASRSTPPGRGFIDGCATQLVSARHYRSFLHRWMRLCWHSTRGQG